MRIHSVSQSGEEREKRAARDLTAGSLQRHRFFGRKMLLRFISVDTSLDEGTRGRSLVAPCAWRGVASPFLTPR